MPADTQAIALFGGVYSNHLALDALLNDVQRRGITRVFCLGDLGAFGPHPDRTCELLREAQIGIVQGNYDNSIGNDLADCQCGYTDPRDNYFARLSYDYTYRRTSPENKSWMRALPHEIRLSLGSRRVLLCHGSPRKMNEFLWETTSSTAFLERLADAHDADVIVATHTGLHWHRALPGGRHFINCGAIGRPANDGRTNVWYAILSESNESNESRVRVEFVPLEYDHERLAAEMRAENLPEEFVETIETGWWTTCLEILPMKERARGKW
jgi:predicted phosphodiesterase